MFRTAITALRRTICEGKTVCLFMGRPTGGVYVLTRPRLSMLMFHAPVAVERACIAYDKRLETEWSLKCGYKKITSQPGTETRSLLL